MDVVLGAGDERPGDRVGPRGQEFKEHAFEWLKPLATTERPRGESRTILERSGQFRALPEGAKERASGVSSLVRPPHPATAPIPRPKTQRSPRGRGSL
jgi:hypothetical protein